MRHTWFASYGTVAEAARALDTDFSPRSRPLLYVYRRKVKDLKYNIIANGHGPVLRHNLEELVGRYKSWSESVGKAAASVAVLYSSDYGFSDR